MATADETVNAVTVGGAFAQNFALGGSVTVNNIGGTVNADVAGGAAATGTTQVTVGASDKTQITGVAGQAAVALGAGAAVGAAATSNNSTRQVGAAIDGAGTTAQAPSVQVTVAVAATINALGAVGAYASTAAGDLALILNNITNTSDAHITGGAVVSGNSVQVHSSDDSNIRALAGAGAGSSTVAVAASTASNEIGNMVSARVDGATVTGGTLDVTAAANDDNPASNDSDFTQDFVSNITSIVIGGAGAGTAAFGGSVAVNDVNNVIDAHIASGSMVTTTNAVHVQGSDDTGIRVVAGNGEGAGTVAGGAAVSTNTSRSQVTAAIDAATVTAPTVEVHTNTGGDVKSAAAVGAGAGTVAADAAISVNDIANRSDAHITGSANVTASQSLDVQAQDSSTIVVITGAGAGAGAVAVAAGVSTNYVQNTVTAFVDGAAQVHVGTMTVTAGETDHLFAVSIGAAGAGAVSVTGGVGDNEIGNTVDAHLSGAAVIVATGDVSVTAQDTSKMEAITGEGGGAGIAGIGGAASYSQIQNQILAYLDGANVTSSGGSLTVHADSDATVESLTAGGNGGLVGIAGNVAVTFVDTAVKAYIARSTVSTFANTVVLAESSDTLTVGAGSVAGGLVGAAGTVAVTTLDGVTQAYLEDATVAAHGNGAAASVPHWDPNTGAESTDSVHGLAVVASSVEKPANGLPTLAAINVAGGFVGLGGLVTVTNVSDETDAFIAGSAVNTSTDFGQAVIVRAHSDEHVQILSGGTAGGFVGADGTIDRTKISSTTRAFISTNDESGSDPSSITSVVYARGVEVSTVSRETIDTTVLGIAGGLVGIGGGVEVVDIAANNSAFVRDSDVYSLGDLAVLANDTSVLNPTVGSLGAGGVGVGTSISLNTIESTIQAQVLGGHLNATGALTVGATSNESLTPLVMTGGVGGAALAGSVAVNNIQTTTEAIVQNGTRNALINQDSRFQAGGSFNPGSGQSVSVTANDTAALDGKTGTASLGAAAGIGASVDVGAVRNRTVAAVGVQSRITAVGDVAVRTNASRSIDSFVIAFAGGIAVGLSGAVSVQSLGADTDGTANTEFDRSASGGDSLRTQVNNSVATPPVWNAVSYQYAGTSPVVDRAGEQVDNLDQPTVDSSTSAITGSDRVTAAFIDDAGAGSGAQIVAGGNIIIESDNLYHLDQSTGNVAVGFVGVGTGIGVGSVHNTTEAYVGNYGTLQAGGDVTVKATDHERDASSSLNTVGGSAGFIALDANVGTLSVQSDTTARLKDNSSILAARNVTVEGDQQSNTGVTVAGFGAGLAAAGAVVGTANVNASVTADVGNGAVVGTHTIFGSSVGNLTVQTSSDNTSDAHAFVAKAGLLAGNFGTGQSTVHADHDADIGGANVNVSGAVNVNANATGKSTAETQELAVGLASGGASTPTATVEGTVQAHIGDGAQIHAASVNVAGQGMNTATADGEAIGAGLVAGNASVVNATDNVTVDGYIDNANVTTTGDIGINTNSNGTAEADSGQVVIGLGAGGASVATATAPATSRAYAGSGAVLHAADVNVQAGSTSGTTAKSNGFALGFLAGNAASATADTEGTTDAYLSGANVTTSGATKVSANGTRTAAATTGQIAGGVVAGGASVANAMQGGTTQAHIDGGSVHAGSATVQSQSNDDTNAHADAFGAGVAAGNAASGTADTEGTTAAFLNGGSVVTTADTTFSATGMRTAEATTGQAAVGVVGGGAAVPNATVGGTTTAYTSGGSVQAGSLTVKSASTEGTTANGSAFGIGVLAGNAAVVTADTHGTSEAYAGTSQVSTTGTVEVNATSTRTAKATTSQVAGGVAAGGAAVANATAAGSTLAHADGQLTAGGDVTVEADDTNSNANASATSFAGGILAGNGSSANASVNPEVRGYLGGGANLNVNGTLYVYSKSMGGESDANASGVTIAAAGGGASDAEATDSPTLEASLRDGSRATATNLTVETQHSPGVSTATAGTSAGTLIGTSGATANSYGQANVASFIGAATVNVAQTVLVQTTVTNNSRAIGNGLSIGLLAGNGDVHATTYVGKETQAYLGSGAVVTAGTLNINAVGNDLATTQASGSGGGLISADATEANSDVGPDILASINDGATATVANTVQVTATASPEGDSVAKAKSFGAAASGESRANDTIHPTVQARVGGNASVTAGDVSITAKSGNPTTPPNDTFNPPTDVNTGADTITLPNNNLPDGAQIVYDSNGNPSIGGLQSGRQYTVLVQDPSTFSLGARFDGSAVNPSQNTITTTLPHNFKTGDQVVYQDDGNAPIPGLMNGQTYYVRVLDDHTIQLAQTLADANASPLQFTPANVDSMGHTINLLFHGLVDNEPLVYEAPNNTQTFKSFMVNVEQNGTGDSAQLINTPGANDIYLETNPFVTGDAVRYECSDPAHPIGGLTPGTVYYVIKLSDNIIQLATDAFNANAGIAQPLTPDQGPAGLPVSHTLTPANDGPISPLVNGTTYYARVLNINEFGLAATPNGALLPLNAAGLTGLNFLLPGIIPLGSGGGSQELRLALTSQPSGPQRIEGPGGVPLSQVYAPSGDGQSTASASGSGGGVFFGGVGGSGVSTATPTVSAYVGAGGGAPAIQARGSITITSTSIANVSGNANNSSGGIVGSGNAFAAANVNNTNQAYVDAGAAIVAGGGITLTANSTQFTNSNADASGGGVIDSAAAGADSDVNYDTKARTGVNAKLTAGGLLQMNSSTSTQASTRAHSDGSGGGVSSNAGDGGGGTTDEGGVRIGVTGDALSQTEVGAGSVLHAGSIDLEAQLAQSQGTSSSQANAFGLGASCDALSRVDEHDHANVAIRSGAQVTGDQTVTMGATTGGITTNVDPHSDCTALGGDTNSTGIADVETTADITTEAGALVTTHTLQVSAGMGTYTHNAPGHERSHALFDVGDEHSTDVFSPVRNIDWNSDVFLTAGPSPTLVINSSGQVTEAQNISYTETANQVIVNNVFFTDPGTAHFTIAGINGLPTPQITGTQSTFGFQENFDNVTITNASLLDLVINQIDPVNRTTIPEVTIDVPNVPFQFTVGQKFTPTLITIQDTAPPLFIFNPVNFQLLTIRSTVYLNDLIDNPIGTTTLSNASGDILPTGPQAVVLTNTFNATTTSGNVGNANNPLQVDLVESGGRQTHMNVAAGNDAYINLTGLQRTLGASSFTVNVDSLSAGGEANVLLEPALRETGLPANWYAVEVSEPLVPHLTEVISHFRPGPGDPPPVVETAVFGINPVAVNSTYNFGLIQGSNIDIFRSGSSTTIGLTGNTNILSTGRIFAITNGNVVLSETVGDMRVGLIESTAGNVTLNSNANIVDAFDDPVADVYGISITLSAPSGSIGSTDNALDVNTATPSFGVLNASALQNIIINETTGPLYIQSATSFSGLIQITVYDSPNPGDDLYVLGGGTVSSLVGSIVLNAGDGIVLEPGSTVSTDLEFGGPITMQANYNDADGGAGTYIYMEGTVRGTNIQAFGGVGPDYFDLSTGRVVGNIQVFGGAGNDYMVAGVDAVWFHGQDGDDYIVGGAGNDRLDGGPGTNQIFGEGGDDTLNGGPNTDFLYGGPGNDTLNGGAGDDYLYGGPGIDQLHGGDGTDYGIAQDVPAGQTDDYDYKFEPGGFNDCELPTEPIIIHQRSALPPLPDAGVAVLTNAQLQPIITEALHRWEQLVGDSTALQGVTFQISNTQDADDLGETYGSTVIINPTAAGHGWFVDPTPADDTEFVASATGELLATSGSAAGRMDLLTVVMHELGHVQGVEYVNHDHDLMSIALSVGVRRLPSAEDVADILHEPYGTDAAAAAPKSDLVGGGVLEGQPVAPAAQKPIFVTALGASENSPSPGLPFASVLLGTVPAQPLPLNLSLPLPRPEQPTPMISPAVRRWLDSVLAGTTAVPSEKSTAGVLGSPAQKQPSPGGTFAVTFGAATDQVANAAPAQIGLPGATSAVSQPPDREGAAELVPHLLTSAIQQQCRRVNDQHSTDPFGDVLESPTLLDDQIRDAAILAFVNGQPDAGDTGNEIL